MRYIDTDQNFTNQSDGRHAPLNTRPQLTAHLHADQLNERHLKRILREFITYYNRHRPHSALGPGFPEPNQVTVPASGHRHRLTARYRVAKTPVLGGLHHEYHLEKEVASPEYVSGPQVERPKPNP